MAKIQWPLTIVWPQDKPETVMPPTWRRLDDGCIEAVYRDVGELREYVRALALMAEAEALAAKSGGSRPEVQIEGVKVHANMDALADYLAKEGLEIVPGNWDWQPHPHDPTRLVPWVPVAPKG